jgi:peptidoglycan/xylan/chitin deacetylase (PgdA/CDA1 family)
MPGWRADSHRARRRRIRLALALTLLLLAVAAPARAATVVSLTFDDGQATQYGVKSTLASHGVHGSFFLNSPNIGTSSFYMTWTQVSALAADGNEIGGHTLTHADLTSTALSDSQKRAEICDDRQNIVAHGFNPVSFAYPYGANDATVQGMVSDCGYAAARRVGGIVSPNWCPTCGTPRAESVPAANALDIRTPSFGSGELTLSAIEGVITQAEGSGGGWIPLVFHGVCETATCGEGWVKPSTLSALLDWLASRTSFGTVVRTVGQVTQRSAPDTSIGSKPAALSRDRSASFGLSSTPSGANFECSRDGGAWTGCSSGVTYTGLTDGQHTFAARAVDDIGLADSTPATWTWTIDATAPETSMTSWPSGTVASTSASFGFVASETGTFECKLDAADWASCTSPKAYSALAQGSHTHLVRAIDTAGNVDDTPSTRTWTVDTVAPDTSIASGPSGTVSSTSAAFGLSSNEAGTFECQLDGTAWAACTSPKSYTGLGAGSHTFNVRAIDAGANTDATPAARTWTVDPSAPETSITSGPSAPVATAAASFAFVANESSTFECKLDAADWAGCTSPKAYSALAEGAHTFSVRATDVAGNVDDTPSMRTWTVDTVAPDSSIAGGPSGTISSSAPSFGLNSTEANSTFECKLDAGAWGACTTPRAYSGLAEGEHTFSLRATDAVGNADASPATRTWTVDTVAPDTSITSGPSAPVSSTSASFAFVASEPASFECRLDDGDWGGCTSAKAYSGLSQGQHTFRVRATDAPGNVDDTPSTRTWTVDTVAPDTSITTGPAGAVSSSAASFGLSSSEASSTFECSLDAADWASCPSPKAYTGLAEGEHTISVRATDAVGNLDATPATRAWTIDTIAPDTSLATGTTGSVATSEASFGFSSPDSSATFECRLDTGGWAACGPPKAYSALADGTHTFSARAVDPVGNVDPTPPTRVWIVDTVAPETEIGSGPAGTAEIPSASFEFSATEDGSFECNLDDRDWEPCESPIQLGSLLDGEHIFAVRATDAVGNVDQTPATHAWTVAVPVVEERPPQESEEPPAESSAGHAVAAAYLKRVLKATARANQGRRLKRLVKRGSLIVKLPRTSAGVLTVSLDLLPDPPGPDVHLARARTTRLTKASSLELRLGKRSRRRLGKLYVAALELQATLVPRGGEAVTQRRVFLAHR